MEHVLWEELNSKYAYADDLQALRNLNKQINLLENSVKEVEVKGAHPHYHRHLKEKLAAKKEKLNAW